jgi:hypothetical protein
MLWRRWTNPLPTLIQVHLSNEGCLQWDNPRATRKVDGRLGKGQSR